MLAAALANPPPTAEPRGISICRSGLRRAGGRAAHVVPTRDDGKAIHNLPVWVGGFAVGFPIFRIEGITVNFGRTLFSQVVDYVPWTSLDRIVAWYGGDVRVRSLRCSEQFRVMAFAQTARGKPLRRRQFLSRTAART
jgi:Domain of unknown function (DUF4372)